MTEKGNFSTLNNSVVPDDKFVEDIDNYNPKISEEIIKQICDEKGLNTSDKRVYIYIYII
jgi:hypothetical protein